MIEKSRDAWTRCWKFTVVLEHGWKQSFQSMCLFPLWLPFPWSAGIYLFWFTSRRKWKPDCVRGLDKVLPQVFCPTGQPALLGLNQRAVWLIHQLTCARFSWTSIPNQFVKVATTTVGRSFSHFPVSRSTTIRDHCSGSWLLDVSVIYAFHSISHPGGRICERPTEQLKSKCVPLDPRGRIWWRNRSYLVLSLDSGIGVYAFLPIWPIYNLSLLRHLTIYTAYLHSSVLTDSFGFDLVLPVVLIRLRATVIPCSWMDLSIASDTFLVYGSVWMFTMVSFADRYSTGGLTFAIYSSQ